jgi:hypothetical protein
MRWDSRVETLRAELASLCGDVVSFCGTSEGGQHVTARQRAQLRATLSQADGLLYRLKCQLRSIEQWKGGADD